MSFANLKKQSTNAFDQLNQQLQKLNTSYKESDNDQYWYPDVDKAGNGYAVIRFLPAPDGEDMPFVRIYDHGFQGPGGWYIEKSLTTLGKQDPVSEYNSKLWNDNGSNAAKDQVRKQMRRTSYHANIYVVKDPSNPQNEGKVFLYRFGKKVFNMLNDLMNPQFPDEAPVNPFDFWGGANFNLKIRNVEGYRNYDKSDFSAPGALLDDDGELEAIWKQQHSLKELISDDKFKTYEELQARLHKALKLDSPTGSAPQEEAPAAPKEEMSFTPAFKAQPETTSTESFSDTGWQDPAPTPQASSSDDDDDLAFFKALADD